MCIRDSDLAHVTQVVLDEADEMLNMGFYKDVRHIIELMKARKSLSMFSATISREVMDIGWLYQNNAEEITVQPREESQPKITQYMLETSGRNKLSDLAQIIIGEGYKRVMVFCDTKFNTATLANQLARLGFSVDCLHGDLSQKERNQIMQNFRDGRLAILVATDVAARGIDVSDVDAVINYDVPGDNEHYTHRIGRTGRDMHVEGVFTNAVTAGLRLARRFGEGHELSVLCIVPPSVRGTRLSSSEEAFTLTGDRLYNPAWGWLDGRVRNSRVRRETVPLALAAYAGRSRRFGKTQEQINGR